MKAKKILTILLLVVLIAAQFSFANFAPKAFANESNLWTSDNHYRYYYHQLDANGKKIYDAMVAMMNNGALKTGTENCDLVEEGYISEELVKQYAQGNNDLMIAFETARDAFYLDYPEVFYVNMEQFSLRVTKGNGSYHAVIGTGKGTSYATEGMTNVDGMITAYNNELREVVDTAKAIDAGEGNLKVKQIEYVHSEILNRVCYRLEKELSSEEYNQCAPHVRNVYGAFINGKVVCEGYSKAIKVVCDQLGIPCILVRGAYKHGTTLTEAHMWNYVNIDGKWYAVDATFDDDDRSEEVEVKFEETAMLDASNPSKVSTEYLLAGEVLMGQRHYPDGYMSAPEKEFVYPELEYNCYYTDKVYSNNGLVVDYVYTSEDKKEGRFEVSYKGMGIAEAEKQGYYFLIKYYQFSTASGQVETNNLWGYCFSDPTYLANNAVQYKDKGDHFELAIDYCQYIEFAVTDMPGDCKTLAGLRYLGEIDDFLATSGMLDIPSGTYLRAPVIKGASPHIDSKLAKGKTANIRLTYEEKLVPDGSGKTPSCTVSCDYRGSNESESGATYSTLTDFVWDEATNSISFKFTPSMQWSDDSVVYYFHIEGLVGQYSQKAPNPAYYHVQTSLGCTASMASSGKYRAFGRPTLIADSDLSTNGWKTSDGTSVSDVVANRIALVVSDTTQKQQEEIAGLIKKKEGIANNDNETIVASKTYNINLSLCKQNIVETGSMLTIYLGFPAGFGPDDAGITFKAYHFIQKGGVVVGVEPINCVVTPYGLLITCNKFSPFAVVEMKSDKVVADNKRFATLSVDGGNGVIAEETNARALTPIKENMISLTEGQSKTYTLQADTGYQIENVTMFGQAVDVEEGATTKQITINYDDILAANPMVSVSYIATAVAQQEQAAGQTAVVPEVNPAVIADMSDTQVVVGNKLEVKPNITASNGADTCQWYKIGQDNNGAETLTPVLSSGRDLVIDHVTLADAGTYRLTVTSTLEGLSKTVSKDVRVTVLEKSIELELTTDATDLAVGDTFDVVVSLKELHNVAGVRAIGGTISYDTNILEIANEGLQEGSGWSTTRATAEFNFVSDNTELQTQGTIFTIPFKVKATIPEGTEQLTIKVSNIEAADGNVDVAYEVKGIDAELNIPVASELTSDDYKIVEVEGQKVITRIPPNTTVSMFKKNVRTGREIVFAQGLTDESLVATGTTIQVGNITYILCVTGDFAENNKDGKANTSDLGALKLHYVREKMITDPIDLLAADIDGNGTVGINDIAALKLHYVGKQIIVK